MRLYRKQCFMQQYGISHNEHILLSVGELNKNKNYETVIRAIADMKDIYYIIAGKGELQEHLQSVIDELGMTERVKLLGYRKDIGELCETADVFVFPSFREGLSVSVMEAMASELPVICSRIRGNTDLIDEVDENGIGGGMFFDPHSVKECREGLKKLLTLDMKKIGEYNNEKIKLFALESVNEQMSKIYKSMT